MVALDLVEHLPREAAFRLLDDMATIAAKKVVGDLESRGFVVVGAIAQIMGVSTVTQFSVPLRLFFVVPILRRTEEFSPYSVGQPIWGR